MSGIVSNNTITVLHSPNLRPSGLSPVALVIEEIPKEFSSAQLSSDLEKSAESRVVTL